MATRGFATHACRGASPDRPRRLGQNRPLAGVLPRHPNRSVRHRSLDCPQPPRRRRPSPQLGRFRGLGLHLYPFQDFVEEIIRVNDPQAKPLSGVQRRLLAEELVADLHFDKKLSHFERIIDTRGFADAVFALLAELKENEIWPDQLAEVAGQRGPKVEQCVRIYQRYQEQLIRNSLYDLEGRFWYARDLLLRGLFQPFEGIRAVFVDGFTRFTRTQHEILETLAGRVGELWIALPDEPGEIRSELFAQPRTTLQKLELLNPQVERLPPAIDRPAGLAHLERQLFRPLRTVERSENADGLYDRSTRHDWRNPAGSPRNQAIVVGRRARAGHSGDTGRRATLRRPGGARKVFAEYGIPVDIEGAEPLLRNPAIATLLCALRLPEDDWPFAGVTGPPLRSGYFQPDWLETRSDPNIAQHAEALLRLLGEPRDRQAYLRAVDLWADHPPKGLEDEEAEELLVLLRIHELAKRCRLFLQRFFRAWENVPLRMPLAEQTTWLRQFADDLGLFRAVAPDRATKPPWSDFSTSSSAGPH